MTRAVSSAASEAVDVGSTWGGRPEARKGAGGSMDRRIVVKDPAKAMGRNGTKPLYTKCRLRYCRLDFGKKRSGEH